MPVDCHCSAQHTPRRLVLTGGPGAGKTAVLQLLQYSLCPHVTVLPESAGILFGGGFPRDGSVEVRRAAQRAIFFVQRELESTAVTGNPAIVLCDRGMLDGIAYWPGPDDFCTSLGVTREDLFRRYDAVIHLRTPDPAHGYGYQNPLRVETPEDAAAIDARILAVWDGHPQRYVIESTADFVHKVMLALAVIRDQLPECCREHIVRNSLSETDLRQVVNGRGAAGAGR